MKHKGYSSGIYVIAVIILVIVVVLILVMVLKSNILAMSGKTESAIRQTPANTQDASLTSQNNKNSDSSSSSSTNTKADKHTQAIAKLIDESNKEGTIPVSESSESSSNSLSSSENKCGCYIVSCCLAKEVIK
ncbi:MAG: hypothetical protein GXN99_00330 [Candidatus Nanohaloarchaeota archaeon]|nr:hypothetical protein [Candidatus Nanohaloarchaeota archaeon]